MTPSNKKEWRKLIMRRNADLPTFCGVALTAYKFLWPLTKTKDEYIFWHFKDGHFTYYIQGIDEHWLGRALYKKYFAKPEQIRALYKEGNLFLKETEKITAKSEHIIAKDRSTNALSDAFKLFRASFDYVNDTFSIMPWWALETWQKDFESVIRTLITKQKREKEYERIFASLLKPWKKTAVISVGEQLKKGISVPKLVEKYQFLRSWTIVWYKPITEEWVKSTADVAVSREKVLSRKELAVLLQPNKEEEMFIEMAPYVSFFKDWRDDLRRQHAFRWHFIFDEIAKYFNVACDDLGYYTLDEISEALENGKLPANALEVRKGGEYILTITPNILKMRVSPVTEDYRRAMAEGDVPNVGGEVRGVVAMTGNVRGKVRLVKTHHDVKKVETGDVLVSNTTHPTYLFGMQRAAAFVTDEGGIASHAAIVARELKKPCIVGTKIATQIFKDGDMVEVDANKGVVKKLK